MKPDLEKHVAFLNQLDDALDDALTRYADLDDSALSELHQIKKEVRVAKQAVRLLKNQPKETVQASQSRLVGMIARRDQQQGDKSKAMGHRILPA